MTEGSEGGYRIAEQKIKAAQQQQITDLNLSRRVLAAERV